MSLAGFEGTTSAYVRKGDISANFWILVTLVGFDCININV